MASAVIRTAEPEMNCRMRSRSVLMGICRLRRRYNDALVVVVVVGFVDSMSLPPLLLRRLFEGPVESVWTVVCDGVDCSSE